MHVWLKCCKDDGVRSLFELIQRLRDQGGYADRFVSCPPARPGPDEPGDEVLRTCAYVLLQICLERGKALSKGLGACMTCFYIG